MSCEKSTHKENQIVDNATDLQYVEYITWKETKENIELNYRGNIDKISKKKLPFSKVILLSSSAVGYIESIDALEQVQGIYDKNWFYSPILHRYIEENKIIDLGISASPDIEKIIKLKPDAIITYTQPEKAKIFKLLENQGIKIIYIDEYREKNALAKAEYIKLYGKLFGKEYKADSLFTVIDDNYKKLKKSVENTNYRPSVFTNVMRGDIWYMSGGKSFMSKYIADAGANFIWKNDENYGTINLSFEQVYKKAKDADFWINTLDFTTMENLGKSYKNNYLFEAYKRGNVYNFTKKINSNGANDYFETGTVRVDWVLSDLIKIFHPEKSKNNQFYFYQKLK